MIIIWFIIFDITLGNARRHPYRNVDGGPNLGIRTLNVSYGSI